MTNQQLYLAIGLPTLTSLITLTPVCLAWISGRASDKELRREMRLAIRALRVDMERWFEAIDRRFEVIDRRFNVIDTRFDALDAEPGYFYGNLGNHDARLNFLVKK